MIGPSPGYQRFYYVHPVVFSSHCWRGTGIRGPTTNLRRPWIGGMAHHTPHLGEGTRLPSNVCGEFDIVWPASKLQKGAPKSGLLFHDDHAFFSNHIVSCMGIQIFRDTYLRPIPMFSFCTSSISTKPALKSRLHIIISSSIFELKSRMTQMVNTRLLDSYIIQSLYPTFTPYYPLIWH